MTSYVCSKHGYVGGDVLRTDKMFDLLHEPVFAGGAGHEHLSPTAYPKQAVICARCVKQLIDDQFAPLREKA